MKINDIDTLSQQFEAEIFVQARWQEPAYRGMDPKVGLVKLLCVGMPPEVGSLMRRHAT